MALLVGCGDDLHDPKTLNGIVKEALDADKLQWRGPKGEELAYAPNSQVPYTGWTNRMFDNGQVKSLAHYEDGKNEGVWTSWYESGQKMSDMQWDGIGIASGFETEYHKNGQKSYEGHVKDGEREGPWTWWYENGQKKMEGHYKDGWLEGLWTRWHENGQKSYEGHLKDDEADGPATYSDENGNEK